MRNPDGIKFEEFALAVNEFQRWNDVIKEVKASREEAREAVIGYMNAFGYRCIQVGSYWVTLEEKTRETVNPMAAKRVISQDVLDTLLKRTVYAELRILPIRKSPSDTA